MYRLGQMAALEKLGAATYFGKAKGIPQRYMELLSGSRSRRLGDRVENLSDRQSKFFRDWSEKGQNLGLPYEKRRGHVYDKLNDARWDTLDRGVKERNLSNATRVGTGLGVGALGYQALKKDDAPIDT